MSTSIPSRLARTLTARLSPTVHDPALLAHAVALGVPWLLAKPERLRPNRADRLRLDPVAAAALERFGRSLGWMADPRHHHGQQASGLAAKTLRAIRAERVDMDGALALAARFRAVRHSHVRRNVRHRVHAPRETNVLGDTGMVATRLVSEHDLRVLGVAAGNCLSMGGYRRLYMAGLKAGTTAVWRVDGFGGAPQETPIWTLAISVETNALDEVHHADEIAFVPTSRDALLTFLSGQGIDCSGQQVEAALAQFALSPALVVAHGSGRVDDRIVGFGTGRWRFQIGTPGVLVAMPLHRRARIGDQRVSSWSLHGVRTGPRSVLTIQRAGATEGDDEDFFYGAGRSGARYMLDLAIRLSLRQVCATRPALRAALVAAFADESPLFVEDWFGPGIPAIMSAKGTACDTND